MKLEVYKEISRAKNCLLIGSSKYYEPIVLCDEMVSCILNNTYSYKCYIHNLLWT